MPNIFRRIPRNAFGDFQITMFINSLLSNADSKRNRKQLAKMPPGTKVLPQEK